MFKITSFKEYGLIIPLVEELNAFFTSGRSKLLNKVYSKLLRLRLEEGYSVPLSYIFSILAENKSITLPDNVISHCIEWLTSSNDSVKVNSIAIIGLYLEQDKIDCDKVKDIYPLFFDLLLDESNDVRNNTIYFLLRLKDKIKFKEYYEKIIQSLRKETLEYNITTLLEFLSYCKEPNLDIPQILDLRTLFSRLIKSYEKSDYSGIWNSLLQCIDLFFPFPEDIGSLDVTVREVVEHLQNYFVMTRISYSKPDNILEYNENYFRTIINSHKTSTNNNILFFYVVSDDTNELFIYYFEEEMFYYFFNQEKGIPFHQLQVKFPDITDKKELRLLISTLLATKRIKGYFSKLGTFFSEKYIITLINRTLETKGQIRTDSFTFLPEEVVSRTIQAIIKESDEMILKGRNPKQYVSSNYIYNKLTNLAKQQNSINFEGYQQVLTKRSFLRLLEAVPTDYLTEYFRRTQLLTNLGMTHILEKLKHSEIIGYYSISQIAQDLNIDKDLVKDVITDIIDPVGGIPDKTGDVFYYTHYIVNKLKNADSIFDEEKRNRFIKKVARKLNVHEYHILKSMKDHMVAIEVEIRDKNQIKISHYMKLTGLDLSQFIDFIDKLELNYLKRGDLLIFNPLRIEHAKDGIKNDLLNQASRKNKILLSSQHFEMTGRVLNTLAQELYEEKKLKGIFYHDGKRNVFFTSDGLTKILLKNQFHFSLEDLFPGKEFTPEDIEFLKNIVKQLVKEKKMDGNFDEEKFIFSSHDMMFARDHEDLFFGFDTLLSKYLQKFQKVHQKIKEILLSKDSVIRANADISIDKIINALQSRFDFWRGDIDGYIANANDILYKRQGLEKEKVKELAKKYNLPSFDSDPQVIRLLTQFREWISLINSIEFRYKSIIFYQKRLEREPENIDSQAELKSLLDQLRMK